MPFSLDFISLRRSYAERAASPIAVARAIAARIRARGEDAVWISRVAEDALLAAAAALERRAATEGLAAMPLYGLPFAIKDNIDVAGLPTTAACPGFAYPPQRSAPAVERLLGAGALSGSGHLNLAVAVGAAIAATLAADVLWYSLGRSQGNRVLGFLCRFSLDPDSLVRHAKERFAAARTSSA